mgnify:FL=1|tara:strand:- start:131 stop:292 length:162 start_codon:yes stop_codon:yes gene_type:complete
MKRFKVERNTGDLGIIYVTLYNPPYENENILHKLGGFKESEVTITEIKTHGEE